MIKTSKSKPNNQGNMVSKTSVVVDNKLDQSKETHFHSNLK